MITIDAILNHLRDKEFSEDELRKYLEDLLYEGRESAACDSLFQFNGKRRRFIDKREKRLREDFKNDILIDINEARQVTKLARAQDRYKENRKIKKEQEKPR